MASKTNDWMHSELEIPEDGVLMNREYVLELFLEFQELFHLNNLLLSGSLHLSLEEVEDIPPKVFELIAFIRTIGPANE